MAVKTWLYGGAAALIVAAVAWAYFQGKADGKALIQARWERAEAAMLNKSIEARDEAEAAIPPLAADPPASGGDRPAGKLVCNDRFDRDCH